MQPLVDAKWTVPLQRETLQDYETRIRQSPEVCQGDKNCSDKLCTENLKCTLGTINYIHTMYY